jgi:hypothetical protein
MAEKTTGALEPGQPGFLPLDESGLPTGDPTVDPPPTGDVFAYVVGAPLLYPDDYLTPTGAPLSGALNPALVFFDDGYLERNPPATNEPPVDPTEPPVLSSISPTSTNTGSQKISARGSNFSAESMIVFGGAEQVTTFNDATWLQATVTSPGVGVYDVLVRDNIGGDSSSLPFEFK